VGGGVVKDDLDPSEDPSDAPSLTAFAIWIFAGFALICWLILHFA
jgi:hypothetical protein